MAARLRKVDRDTPLLPSWITRAPLMQCDVLVVGGGLGGCAAALAAAEAGRRVVLTEPTDWIGGQVSQQGVPPDEHRLIEQVGATRRYRAYREGVRAYYRRWFPLHRRAFEDPHLNPGGARVSRLSHLPAVSVAVLEAMLASHRYAGRLTLLLNHEPISAEVVGDRVRTVTFRTERGDERVRVEPSFVIDASEWGDLLPLTDCEYTSGAEGQAAFGEPSACAEADPHNVQAVTWCFAMDMVAGECVIDRPEDYDHWRDYIPQVQPPWPGRLLSWVYPHPPTLSPRRGTIEPLTADQTRQGEKQSGMGVLPLWNYRQILDPTRFEPQAASALAATADARYPGITLVNWPQNDYFGGALFDCPDAEHHRRQAKRLSLSLFYWLQTEAPRPDGGTGYPGLRLRGDVLGTRDGFAKYPYIREARRIQAPFTVTEHHVGVAAREGENESARFDDSVGIGSYHLDLHPSTGGDNYIDVPSFPFQIPLRALVPVRLENLLPGAKNLSVSHIANGCYRLHPVEWNIGEAAGVLADYCLRHSLPSQAVPGAENHVQSLQQRLMDEGVPLDWPAVRVPPLRNRPDTRHV